MRSRGLRTQPGAAPGFVTSTAKDCLKAAKSGCLPAAIDPKLPVKTENYQPPKLTPLASVNCCESPSVST